MSWEALPVLLISEILELGAVALEGATLQVKLEYLGGLCPGFLQREVFGKSGNPCLPSSSCPWTVSLFSLPPRCTWLLS